MRILILGGTSLTGPIVVRRLVGLGHDVTVYHRGEHETELPAAVRHLHGDFLHLPPEVRHPAPDVVVHMWAATEADAHAFLDAFGGVAARAVAISSGDVYRAYGRAQRLESGAPGPIPLSEDAPLRESRYPYQTAYDKVLVERTLAVASELPVTILRFPAIYGPNDGHRMRRWLEPMLRGVAELRLQEDFALWRWTHGFSEDVAESVVLAATSACAAGRVYNVGEPEAPTIAERLAAFARVSGWRGSVRAVPAIELPEPDRMPQDFSHHLVYDTTRIRAELGYRELVPYDQGLARTLEWERAASGVQ